MTGLPNLPTPSPTGQGGGAPPSPGGEGDWGDEVLINMMIFLLLLSLSLVSPAPAQRPATSNDLKFPEQEIETMEGEIVWLQGAILGGNPQQYRNPQGPLAAYEQGILDENGALWTVLDTPEGRELRYNPDLRGKKMKIRGWFHPQSRIIEVKEWQAGKHKVRINEDYEPPERLPFDPVHAETIESIPPIPLQPIEENILKGDLWLQGEGYDLGLHSGGKLGPDSPTVDSLQLKKLLDELDKELGRRGIPPATKEIQTPPSRVLPMAPIVKPATGNSMIPIMVPSPTEVTVPKPPPGPPLLDEEGHPVTRPEDFDEALHRELIQQIVPQK